MRHKTFIAVAAMVGLLTASCIKENEPTMVQTPITINATYAANGTKVSYSEDGATISATWQAGDQLKVVYNGSVNTLTLTSGAGTASASFSGSITGTPSATSMLICYVSDANNPGAVNVSGDGSYTYTSGTFLGQDGTLAGAARCNLYYGVTQYGDGTGIGCSFNVNTSMMKFTVTAPALVGDGDAATLTYKSDGTAIARASFTVGEYGENTVYIAIPAGNYSGVQELVYASGGTTETHTLSATAAHFTAGETYSKTIWLRTTYDLSELESGTHTISENCLLTGTAGNDVTIQIADGTTVTLGGVSINADGQSSGSHAGIVCLGDATIRLQNGSVNTVKGVGDVSPGIYVPSGSTLTIDGGGTLNAIASSSNGSFYGAGIGAGYGSSLASNMPCGNIVINGGIINAQGGNSSAGIGGSNWSSCGSITIASTVTSVTASTCSSSDTPIGRGNYGWPSSMTFGGNTVYTNGDEWPELTNGTNYGGLTLSITTGYHGGHTDNTWTLTPAK